MLKQKTYQFCNNCGKQGHLFSQCKLPVISVGIIAYKYSPYDKKYKYLMICRKDSLGYIEFLRGKYPLYNKEYIQNLIDEMTIDEKNNLLTKDFDELWKDLWGDFVDLESIIHCSTTNWNTPEWGFPKGRRNYQESDIACAVREFQEETGYTNNDIDIVTNIQPFEEIFIGSNFKSYKHKYFLANIFENQIPKNNYQKSEVSDLRWFTLEDCVNKIRPYNLEKIQIIKDIDEVLHKYRLIS
jgi:8-oxo-dGTP pyrophosphatase MutT (NUDIX family)